jgi:predicted nucleic acid-binding protein
MAADDAVVCDASAFAAMVFGEPGSAEAHSLTRSRRLLAPSLLRYEVAQVAIRKCASGRGDAGLVEQEFAASFRVPVRLVEPSWRAVFRLARTNGLSAYDASYLQLALELRVPLATLDKRLAETAEALGIRAAPRVD